MATFHTDPENLGKKIDEILKKRISGKVNKTKRAMQMSVMTVRDTVILGLMSGGSGKSYKKYNPQRTHIASKPGDYPATDTGFLVSQISTNVIQQGETVIGQIISAAPYSKHLEFGTARMLQATPGGKRPFMQPSLEVNKRKIRGIFQREGVLKK